MKLTNNSFFNHFVRHNECSKLGPVNSKILPQNLSGKPLPAIWQPIIQSHLNNAEELHAWIEINLDAQLHFTEHLLIITNQRLVYFDVSQSNTGIQSISVTEHPFRASLNLRHSDHAGVFKLQLFDGDLHMASWCYTLGSDVSSTRFIKLFEQQSTSFLTGQAIVTEKTEPCPKCQYPLTADQDE